MEVLLPAISGWFADKHEHLSVFAQTDCRLEGWFKGELLVLFARLCRTGVLADFEREASIALPGGRAQIDFRLRVGTEDHLCEIKALCISQAAGTPRNLNFYFRDDRVGLLKDMRKLDSVPAINKWLLAFVYPAPEPAAWERAMASLPRDLAHWRAVTQIRSDSADLFVSLWQDRDAVAGEGFAAIG